MVAAMGASHDDNIIRVGQLGHSAINMTRLLSGPACSAILLRHFGAPPLCADGTSCHRTLVPHRVRCGTLSYIGCELLVIRKLRSFVDYFLGRPSLYCTIPFHRRKPYFVARGIHRQILNWTMDSGRSPMLAIDLGHRAFGHFNGAICPRGCLGVCLASSHTQECWRHLHRGRCIRQCLFIRRCICTRVSSWPYWTVAANGHDPVFSISLVYVGSRFDDLGGVATNDSFGCMWQPAHE